MKLFTLFLLLTSSSAFAEGSKLIKVDLDVPTTEIVLADLGQHYLYYWIDKSTCVCGVFAGAGASRSVATVDCNKLKKNPKLAEHLTQCN